LFPLASVEVRRQFDDFYNRPDPEVGRSDSGWRRLSTQTKVDPRRAATQTLPHEPAPTWQQRATRTSARPSGQRRRTGAASSRMGSSASSLPASRSRTVLYSIALGVLLAVAALIVVGLAVRP